MEASQVQGICSRCGAGLINIVIIDGKVYGTECAASVLGLKELPSWFKGGDWTKASEEHRKDEEQRAEEFKIVRERTSKYWSEFIRLSKAYYNARVRGNEFGTSFISSISQQAGFPNLACEKTSFFETFEEAEKNWNMNYMGSFPYIYRDIKGLSGLSAKQISLLEKIESKCQ